jgi:hypothetical protein
MDSTLPVRSSRTGPLHVETWAIRTIDPLNPRCAKRLGNTTSVEKCVAVGSNERTRGARPACPY